MLGRNCVELGLRFLSPGVAVGVRSQMGWDGMSLATSSDQVEMMDVDNRI
jgi:hypothetical protein